MEECEVVDRKTQREQRRHVLQQHRAEALLNSPRAETFLRSPWSPVASKGESFIAALNIHKPESPGGANVSVHQYPWENGESQLQHWFTPALEEASDDAGWPERECAEMLLLLKRVVGVHFAGAGGEGDEEHLARELEENVKALGSRCDHWHRRAETAELLELHLQEAHVGLAACEQSLCDSEDWREKALVLEHQVQEAHVGLAACEQRLCESQRWREQAEVAEGLGGQVQEARGALAACERRLHESEQWREQAEAAEGLKGQVQEVRDELATCERKLHDSTYLQSELREARETMVISQQKLRDSEQWRKRAEAAEGLNGQVQETRDALAACEQRLLDSEQWRERAEAAEGLQGQVQETSDTLAACEQRLCESEQWREEAAAVDILQRQVHDTHEALSQGLRDCERWRLRAEVSEQRLRKLERCHEQTEASDSERFHEQAETLGALKRELHETREALAASQQSHRDPEHWEERAQAAELLEDQVQQTHEARALCTQRLREAEHWRNRAEAAEDLECRVQEAREALADGQRRLHASEVWHERAEAADALACEVEEGRNALAACEQRLLACERWREQAETAEALEARIEEAQEALATCQQRLCECRDQWNEHDEVEEVEEVEEPWAEQLEAVHAYYEQQISALQQDLTRSQEQAPCAAAKDLECSEYREILHAYKLETGETHRESELLRERAAAAGASGRRAAEEGQALRECRGERLSAERSLGAFAEEQVRMSRQRGELLDELLQLRERASRASAVEGEGWAAAREESGRVRELQRECAELHRHVVDAGTEVLRLNLRASQPSAAGKDKRLRGLREDDWLHRPSLNPAVVDHSHEDRLDTPLWDGFETLKENAAGVLDAGFAALSGDKPRGGGGGGKEAARESIDLLDAVAHFVDNFTLGHSSEPPPAAPPAAKTSLRQSPAEPNQHNSMEFL